VKQQQNQLRQRIQSLSHKLSATCLGQDRYRRRYWILPRFGGLLVEGLESGEPESCDPTAPETDDVLEAKDSEENQEKSDVKQTESDDKTSKNEEGDSNFKDVALTSADNDTKMDSAEVSNNEAVKLESTADDELKHSENCSTDETLLIDSNNGNKIKSEESDAQLPQPAVKIEDCDTSAAVKHEMDIDAPSIKANCIDKIEHSGETDSSKPSLAADSETSGDNKETVDSTDKTECLSAAADAPDNTSASVSNSALDANRESQTVDCNNSSGDSSKWLPHSVPGEHSSSALLLSLVMQNVSNGASKEPAINSQSNDAEPVKEVTSCNSPSSSKVDVTPAVETDKDEVSKGDGVVQSSPSATVVHVSSSGASPGAAAAGDIAVTSLTPVKQAAGSFCETPQSQSQAGTPNAATPSSAADPNSVGQMQLPEPGTHLEFDALISRVSDTTLLATPVQDLIALAVTDGELPPDCLSEPKTLRSIPLGM
jgi:hypothetical protein